MSGVISVKERGDAKSLANETPSASFVEALFSEAVKIKIARKIIYQVHDIYYTPAERF